MPQTQTMTLDEKLAISNKALALSKAGDEEGYRQFTYCLIDQVLAITP